MNREPLRVRRHYLVVILLALATSWLNYVMHFDQNGFGVKPGDSILNIIFKTVMLSGMGVINILTVLTLFDFKPVIIIDDEGIWKRQNILPFSPLELIPFVTIESYAIEVIRGKGTTHQLSIGIKGQLKNVTIGFDNTDTPRGEILDRLQSYAEKYQFVYLGKYDK